METCFCFYLRLFFLIKMKRFLLICLTCVVLFQATIQVTVLGQKEFLEKVQKELLKSRKIHSKITLVSSTTRKNMKKENKTEKQLKMLQELIRRHDERPNFFRMLARYGKRAKQI